MVTMIIVGILLTINMFLMHIEYLGKAYSWTYKKLRKPKFISGELVMIGNTEFKVMYVTKNHRPYTYYCTPVSCKKKSYYVDNYYHESEIKKKTGLLKELE
jgi:hypothetical protein